MTVSPALRAAAIAACALAATACSGSDDVGDATTSAATVADRPPAGSEPAAPATDAPATDAAVRTEPPGTDAATTTIGTVPDEGVPGIDSSDAFCRSWSEFAGSFQALAIATSFGTDEQAASRLEVAAAPALIAAVGGLDEHLPDELGDERSALVDDLAGPLLRRAQRARDALAAAGLSGASIEALGATWLATLAATGLDEPDIELVVPATIDAAAVDAAAAELAAALPPIDRDPSLITDARVPRTERYLADNCPDRGTLGGNDVIDEL